MKTKIVWVLLFCSVLKTAEAQPPQQNNPDEQSRIISEKMQQDFNLNNVQKEKIKAAFSTFFTGMKTVMKDAPPPPPPPKLSDKEKAAADKLIQARNELLKKVLTGEQFALFLEKEKAIHPENQPPPAPNH